MSHAWQDKPDRVRQEASRRARRNVLRNMPKNVSQTACAAARMCLTPVAHIHTPFPEKFGIPRQSGLVDTPARIVFTPPYRRAEAVRGLEMFSHIWLIWQFSQSMDTAPHFTVRPPRLGGNRRCGVFATRSPFRPNHLGLSCVRLLEVEIGTKDGPVLHVSGADLLHQTPIYDIKPYLPFTDAHVDAVGGFADKAFSHTLQVTLSPSLVGVLPTPVWHRIQALLAQDIRPSYQNDPTRVYAMCYDRYQIRFTVKDGTATVCAVEEKMEDDKLCCGN